MRYIRDSYYKIATLCCGLLCIAFQGYSQEYREKTRRRPDTVVRPSNPTNSPTRPTTPTNPQTNAITEPQTIQSVVLEAGTNEPIGGAYVKVMGALTGAITDNEGRFTLKASLPATLEVSAIGYSTATIGILNAEVLARIGTIELKSDEFMTDVVVVSASRISEKLNQAPAAIYKMEIAQLRSTPSLNPVDALAFLNQLEVTTSSFGVKNINARGFNQTNNIRFPHRIDGMEMLSPAFSFYLGAVDSWATLDVDNIEIISGPSSGLYGANAINGAMNTTTKSPFDYQGLSASIRSGVFRLGNPNSDINPNIAYGESYRLPAAAVNPVPLAHAEIRYAKALNDKWAFKFNVAVLNTDDWIANDYNDKALTTRYVTDNRPTSLGFDEMNSYGDEVAALVYGPTPFGLVTKNLSIARTGFREKDLTDYSTRTINSAFAIHYRPNSNHEFILASRYNTINGVFQSGNENRYRVDNALFTQHKLEWRSQRMFVRLYSNRQWENVGLAYDMNLAGQEINNRMKPHAVWFGQFLSAYQGTINPLLVAVGRPPLQPGDGASARTFADSDNRYLVPFLQQIGASDSIIQLFAEGGQRYNPGTPQFESIYHDVKNANAGQGGARVYPAAHLYNLEGQFDLSQYTGQWVDVLLGVNLRYNQAFTKNSAYQDDVEAVQFWEAGMYLQLQRKWLNNRLKTLGSIRADAHTEFKPQISPRIGATYALDNRERHIIRAFYQTAFRFPTMTESYLNLSYGSSTRTIGGLSRIMDRNGIRSNSLYPLGNALTFGTLIRTGDTLAAFQALGQPLRPASIESERIQTYELGYRGTWLEKLSVDLTGFYSVFKDFIYITPFVGPDRNRLLTTGEPLSYNELASNRFSLYTVPINLQEDIYYWGFNGAMSYALSQQYKLMGTYAYLDLQSLSSIALNSFNVARHRASIGLEGRELWKNVGFMANYRWNDSFVYNYYPIPAYQLVDLGCSYRYRPWKTIFSINAINVLNHYHIEIAGGPQVGGVYYLQVNFDQLLN
jgi:iron complex outermembrane recepter protein